MNTKLINANSITDLQNWGEENEKRRIKEQEEWDIISDARSAFNEHYMSKEKPPSITRSLLNTG
jgi:hypothetical protein